MQRSRLVGRPATGGAVLAGAAVLALLSMLALPWVQVTLPATGVHVRTGLDAAVFSIPAVVLTAIMALAGVGAMTGVEGAVQLGLCAAAGLAVVCIAEIALIETFASIVPTSLLPATVRRVSFDVRAGAGLWTSLVCGVTAGLAQLRGPVRMTGRVRLSLPRVLTFVAPAGVALLAYGWLRYEPWLDARAANVGSVGLEAWALPWIGPGSLLPIWLLGASLGAAVLRWPTAASLLAALAGWLLSFAAALTVLAGDAIGRGRLIDLLPENARQFHPHVGVTWQVWMVFGLGLVVVAGAASLLMEESDSGLGAMGRGVEAW